MQAIINCLAVNEDGVLVSGADNGSIWFWDWKSGNAFQQQETVAQPGSLDSEQGGWQMQDHELGSMSSSLTKTVQEFRNIRPT